MSTYINTFRMPRMESAVIGQADHRKKFIWFNFMLYKKSYISDLTFDLIVWIYTIFSDQFLSKTLKIKKKNVFSCWIFIWIIKWCSLNFFHYKYFKFICLLLNKSIEKNELSLDWISVQRGHVKCTVTPKEGYIHPHPNFCFDFGLSCVGNYKKKKLYKNVKTSF